MFLLVAAVICLSVFLLLAAAARRAGQGARAPGRGRRAAGGVRPLLPRRGRPANIGHGGERYTPYILTLFFFILFTNLLGLVPWGATATGNIAVTAALALLSFIVVEVSGIGRWVRAGT